jgi:hypothetical protein
MLHLFSWPSALHDSEFILIAGLGSLLLSITVNGCNLELDRHSVAREHNDRQRAVREFERPPFHIHQRRYIDVVARR